LLCTFTLPIECDVDICSSDVKAASENIDNDISESRSKNDNTEIVLNQVVKDNIKVNTSIILIIY
jgi:hypothetical protein